MGRNSEQNPRPPVGADSFIYDPELATPEPPPHLTAIPEGALAGKMRPLMFAQVVLRYVFASPFVGIEELSLLFGAWFHFLGIAHVTRNGEHIHGGILTMVVANRNAVRLAMTLLGIVACVLAAIVLLPVATEIGVHPIHFAAIVGSNLGLGNVSPPCAPMLYHGGRGQQAHPRQVLHADHEATDLRPPSDGADRHLHPRPLAPLPRPVPGIE